MNARAQSNAMFYVLQSAKNAPDRAITVAGRLGSSIDRTSAFVNDDLADSDDDIDFVDDTILNTAPHNPIERQLLTGDVIGLALMSGAIIWTAMGAIA